MSLPAARGFSVSGLVPATVNRRSLTSDEPEFDRDPIVFLVAKGFLAAEAKLLLETGFFAAPTVGAPIAVLARLMAASLAFSSPFSLLRPFLCKLYFQRLFSIMYQDNPFTKNESRGHCIG